MILGIDLGTTNSLCALWQDGEAQLLPNALGEFLTPSVVGLDDQDQLLVGRAAAERLITHPKITTATFKRAMGTDRTVRLGRKAYRPEELSAMVLRSLKADAEAFLGREVDEAVITVPAYFSEAQRKATRIAGELAGLKVERLLNEPTAAALAYGLHHQMPESQFLVFDLGGGTFDVSVLELFDGVMEVRASTGDSFLGGEDFVDVLVKHFISRHQGDLPALAGHDLQSREPRLYRALRDQAERCKLQLSAGDSGSMRLRIESAADAEARHLEFTVSAGQFADWSRDLLQRLRSPVERALRDSRIRASELDQVVLAGGATRAPLVRRLVATLFGRMPAMQLDPDHVVALGAAVQAGLKAKDEALREVVLTDVCPHTLGIELTEQTGPNSFQHGLFSPLIERNTTIPASRSMPVVTVQDHQRQVQVRIYQGEARLVRDNIFLGSLDVPVPRARAGESELDVRFTYDVNGLLECEVTVAETGEVRRLVIEERPGTLSDKEIAKSLAALEKLKVHPRDEQRNTALLARAERLFQESLGDQRQHLGAHIRHFEQQLESQDPEAVERAAAQLSAVLDVIDNDPYLDL